MYPNCQQYFFKFCFSIILWRVRTLAGETAFILWILNSLLVTCMILFLKLPQNISHVTVSLQSSSINFLLWNHQHKTLTKMLVIHQIYLYYILKSLYSYSKLKQEVSSPQKRISYRHCLYTKNIHLKQHSTLFFGMEKKKSL